MLIKHVTRCFIAGFVALLPVGGLVLTVAWLEMTIAETWLARQWYYFPGLGLLAVAVALYLVGLVVTTFVGKWIWRSLDALLSRLPGFGPLYATLKQVLGYGEGSSQGALFREVVLVPHPADGGEQLGLLTERIGAGAEARAVVFLPSAPNPTSGQLVLFDLSVVRATSIQVDEALRALVSLGKSDLKADGLRAALSNRAAGNGPGGASRP